MPDISALAPPATPLDSLAPADHAALELFLDGSATHTAVAQSLNLSLVGLAQWLTRPDIAAALAFVRAMFRHRANSLLDANLADALATLATTSQLSCETLRDERAPARVRTRRLDIARKSATELVRRANPLSTRELTRGSVRSGPPSQREGARGRVQRMPLCTAPPEPGFTLTAHFSTTPHSRAILPRPPGVSPSEAHHLLAAVGTPLPATHTPPRRSENSHFLSPGADTERFRLAGPRTAVDEYPYPGPLSRPRGPPPSSTV